MSDAYTVCRAGQLAVADLFLEPWSGTLAKVTKIERHPKALRPITIHYMMTVSKSVGSIELPDARLMRRQWRPGERDGDQKAK